METKSTLQKCYEKMQMIKMHPDKLRLLVGRNKAGEPSVILGIDSGKEGESVIPVAILMDQNRINKLVPDWEYSQKIQPIIDDAMKCDLRHTLEHFSKQDVMVAELFEEADF